MSSKIVKITDLLINENYKNINKEEIKKVLENIYNEIYLSMKLYHPDPNCEFELRTDVSKHGYEGTFTQKNKIIAICSGKYNKTQSLYPPMELELYSVIHSLKKFKNIIFGSRIILYSDNKNLLSDSSFFSSKAQRWKLLISEYDIELKHIKGKNNEASDFLLRINTIYNENICIENLINCKNFYDMVGKDNRIKIKEKLSLKFLIGT